MLYLLSCGLSLVTVVKSAGIGVEEFAVLICEAVEQTNPPLL